MNEYTEEEIKELLIRYILTFLEQDMMDCLVTDILFLRGSNKLTFLDQEMLNAAVDFGYITEYKCDPSYELTSKGIESFEFLFI